jgi:hypothetical protein
VAQTETTPEPLLEKAGMLDGRDCADSESGATG